RLDAEAQLARSRPTSNRRNQRPGKRAVRQAVILAGGKGTRLASVLNGLPKPLVDVCGKPLLLHQLELLSAHDFTDAVVMVNHRAEAVRELLAGVDLLISRR